LRDFSDSPLGLVSLRLQGCLPFALHVTRAPWSVFQDGRWVRESGRRLDGKPPSALSTRPQRQVEAPFTRAKHRTLLPQAGRRQFSCRRFSRTTTEARLVPHRSDQLRLLQRRGFATLGFIRIRSVSQSQRSPGKILRPFRPPAGVLCTFPSWYLCAIGLPFRDLAFEDRYLRSSVCTLKQTYSILPKPGFADHPRGFYALWRWVYTSFGGSSTLLQGSTPHCPLLAERLQGWALPGSLAVTSGISVDFFWLRLFICLNSAGDPV